MEDKRKEIEEIGNQQIFGGISTSRFDLLGKNNMSNVK